ncbi:Predicted mitochondrial carrier protein [Phaffia rhodozyma]|uniref:Predicted mitochondrial carrier protein n=1 Tax=Phaffia rhodozyma TaxID=264483 RepID=A0A0F7SJX1_PHARH|nr:Predicted mitochondrial carrier protein [Phaffia rhodozyma]
MFKSSSSSSSSSSTPSSSISSSSSPGNGPTPALPCANAEKRAGVPAELTAFRAREGKHAREKKLRELWANIPYKEQASKSTSKSTAAGAAGAAATAVITPTGSTQSAPPSGGPSSRYSNASSSWLNPLSSTFSFSSSSSSSSSSAPSSPTTSPSPGFSASLSPERAEFLQAMYQEELVRRCSLGPTNPQAREFAGEGLKPEDDEPSETPTSEGKQRERMLDWKEFRTYLWEREAELWHAFQDLDRNQDGVLDVQEIQAASARADISLTPATIQDFVSYLTHGEQSRQARGENTPEGIRWIEFRDMFLLLPRKASVPEFYRFYQYRKQITDGRGAARLNSDGDITPSFPSLPSTSSSSASSSSSSSTSASSPSSSSPTLSTGTISSASRSKPTLTSDLQSPQSTSPSTSAGQTSGSETILDGDHDTDEEEEEEEEEEDANHLSALVAVKFLGAGGVAGAISRTATAPFDRLKVFLITDSHGLSGGPSSTTGAHTGYQNLKRAIMRLYFGGGGLRAFWVGNGLNVIKIMPESAIKFFSYESSKRLLARYWDDVEDPSLISGSSRFLAGGLGGIASQFSIYPLETLKTAHMTTAGSDHSAKVLLKTAATMWANGGVRRYYRGLTLGLVGVFPYAAIDMSTFETLKIHYCRHQNVDEPETYAVLAFGAISGGVGATSVYPMNLLRTKLQASGSTGHPQVYNGFLDVAQQTINREGWRGLYRGLTVNLAKVVPAVSISYVVYENTKKYLHI